MIIYYRMMTNHGTTPYKYIISQCNTGMYNRRWHNKTIIAEYNIERQIGQRANNGYQVIPFGDSLIAFCFTQPVEVMIAYAYKHIIICRRISFFDSFKRNNR